jgi:hypothetical protein
MYPVLAVVCFASLAIGLRSFLRHGLFPMAFSFYFSPVQMCWRSIQRPSPKRCWNVTRRSCLKIAHNQLFFTPVARFLKLKQSFSRNRPISKHRLWRASHLEVSTIAILRNSRGQTLVQVMVAAAVGVIVMLAIVTGQVNNDPRKFGAHSKSCESRLSAAAHSQLCRWYALHEIAYNTHSSNI